MDISQLQAIGGLSPRSLQKRTVEFTYPKPTPSSDWEDPTVPEYPELPEMVKGSLDVWVRKQSSADYIEMVGAQRNERSDLLLIRCVCHEDGRAVFTAEQVTQLKEWIYIPLLLAVNEVNNAAAKKARPRTSGGAT